MVFQLAKAANQCDVIPSNWYFIFQTSADRKTHLQICSQVCSNEKAVMDPWGPSTMFGWSANGDATSGGYASLACVFSQLNTH